MQQGQNTEDQLRILFAAYNRDNPANPGLIQKISEQLGVQKLIPNVLPDNVEVR
jgi:hypothetical protein